MLSEGRKHTDLAMAAKRPLRPVYGPSFKSVFVAQLRCRLRAIARHPQQLSDSNRG